MAAEVASGRKDTGDYNCVDRQESPNRGSAFYHATREVMGRRIPGNAGHEEPAHGVGLVSFRSCWTSCRSVHTLGMVAVLLFSTCSPLQTAHIPTTTLQRRDLVLKSGMVVGRDLSALDTTQRRICLRGGSADVQDEFVQRTRKILESGGGAMDSRAFSTKWKEQYPDDDFSRYKSSSKVSLSKLVASTGACYVRNGTGKDGAKMFSLEKATHEEAHLFDMIDHGLNIKSKPAPPEGHRRKTAKSEVRVVVKDVEAGAEAERSEDDSSLNDISEEFPRVVNIAGQREFKPQGPAGKKRGSPLPGEEEEETEQRLGGSRVFGAGGSKGGGGQVRSGIGGWFGQWQPKGPIVSSENNRADFGQDRVEDYMDSEDFDDEGDDMLWPDELEDEWEERDRGRGTGGGREAAGPGPGRGAVMSHYQQFLRQIATETPPEGRLEVDGAVSVFAMQGRRDYMEDEFAVRFSTAQDSHGGRVSQMPSMFGVFDGHGGANVSRYCREVLLKRAAEFITGSGGDVETDTEGEEGEGPAGEKGEGKAGEEEGGLLSEDLEEGQDKEGGRGKERGAEAGEGRAERARSAVAQAAGDISKPWLRRAVEYAFEQTDREVIHSGWLDGTTAVVLAVARSFLLVANVGDSRAILVDEQGSVTALSSDHKPSRRDELLRIEDLGGFVLHLGVPRVNGILAVSRAIGDAELKHLVPSEPEIRSVRRTRTQRFVVMASDGVWDVMANQEVADIVRDRWGDEGHGAKAVAEQAYKRGSFDNICCMVVDLTATKEAEGGGEGGRLSEVLEGVYSSSEDNAEGSWAESTTSLKDVSGAEAEYDGARREVPAPPVWGAMPDEQEDIWDAV